MSDTPVIQTFELSKRFREVRAVDRVSIAVERGQVFGFLGPNGSGKTTTIGMLMGIITPTAGSFALFGASDPRGHLAARTRVGATLETPNFYPYMSGRDNLRVAATIKGVGRAGCRCWSSPTSGWWWLPCSPMWPSSSECRS